MSGKLNPNLSDILMVTTLYFFSNRNAFGPGVIDDATGRINRDALRLVIVENADARRKLNAITHPRIRYKMVLKIVAQFLKGNQV